MKRLDGSKLEDATAERVRRSHHEAIQEWQASPAAATQIINDVVLPNGAVVLVAHKLGRPPRIVLLSPVHGAPAVGIIVERRDAAAGNPDRAKYIALQAGGMGATVTVDVEVK